MADSRPEFGIALVGWPPIGIAIASLAGEVTGCGRFAASCIDMFAIGTWLAQITVIVILLALPTLAAVSAVGTLAALAASVPTAVFLSATGGSREPVASGAILAGVLAIAYVAGAVLALVRRVGPGPRPARTMTAMHRRHDANDLSAAAQEYLLTLRVMAGDGSHVKAAQVARRMGVTTQASSEMFRRLASDGLVHQSDGRELVLTAAGRAAADAIFRRHALLEWLLTAVVGLGWAESDEEAGRLQGAISPRVEARLDEMLGHPETCPHGNPIDAATTRRRPPGIPLSDIEGGQQATIYRITEEAEEDAGLLSYLEARALTPGAHITVLARSESLDSLTLEGPRGRATLGLRPAALVHVLRGDADPALFHQVPASARG